MSAARAGWRPKGEFCPACRAGMHTRCWELLEPAQCPCDCWDEQGMLTEAALLDMMSRQRYALARYVRFTGQFARGSYDVHVRRNVRRR